MKISIFQIISVSAALLLTACSSTEEKNSSLLSGPQGQPVDSASTNSYQNGQGVTGTEFNQAVRDLMPAELGAEFTDPNNP